MPLSKIISSSKRRDCTAVVDEEAVREGEKDVRLMMGSVGVSTRRKGTRWFSFEGRDERYQLRTTDRLVHGKYAVSGRTAMGNRKL